MNILEQIKDRVSMLQVLEVYGQHSVRGKNNYCCFIHIDKNPSAGLTKNGDKFHCFSCGWTGNIFDVVQHFEKCDVKTAMRILDDKFKLGVFRDLSREEKLEIKRQMKMREKQLKEKLWWERFEEVVLEVVVEELRNFEQLEKCLRIKKGQYRDEWSKEFADTYFYVLKGLDWLEWLYSAICGMQHKECEYDYMYPHEKMELLKMIKDGIIQIPPESAFYGTKYSV